MKNICIILLNFNGTDDTIECIESIEKTNIKSINLKVIIVDNDSHIEQFKKLEDYLFNKYKIKSGIFNRHDKYFLLRSAKNIGFATGNNKGIRVAEELLEIDYYLLLNNDTTLDEESILRLSECFNDKNVGAASGMILDFSTKSKVWYAGGSISRLKAKGKHHYYGYKLSDLQLRRNETRFLSGCYVMFERNALLNIGLLNERYFFGTEEYDYSLKLRKLGYKLLFEPKSVIYHKVDIDEGNGSSHNIKDSIYLYNSMRNKYLLNYNNYSMVSTKIWVIISKIYIKYILRKRLRFNNINKTINKGTIDALYNNYVENLSKYYIDNKEFHLVKNELEKLNS